MEGLEKFCEAFAEFTNNYVVIGGTACDIAMTGTVVRPRATHDIDMIDFLSLLVNAVPEQQKPQVLKKFLFSLENIRSKENLKLRL